MNTKDKAIREIRTFLESENSILLLTGTHQFEKHILALSIFLSEYPSPASILYRTNHTRNIRLSLLPIFPQYKNQKRGTPITIQGRHLFYVDTINQKSWSSTPFDIDVAVVYPIDDLKHDDGDDCVQDLIRRKSRKIILVSCTDNKDISWTNHFNPVHVIYDAEEKHPEYHERMIKNFSTVHPERITGLPGYAQSTPDKYLIKVLCKGRCHARRWARLNKPYPGKSALYKAEMRQYTATCLKCGSIAMDNYNWHR